MSYDKLRLANPKLFFDGVDKGLIPSSEVPDTLQVGQKVTSPMIEGALGGPYAPESYTFDPFVNVPFGGSGAYPKPWRSAAQKLQDDAYTTYIGPFAKMIGVTDCSQNAALGCSMDTCTKSAPPLPEGTASPPSGYTRGKVGGSTNGKSGQPGSEGWYEDDEQDSGVDIELYGPDGQINITYGRNSDQGPYGGRGVEISFPFELTYNEFVPGGRNAGSKSVEANGWTTDRIYKDPNNPPTGSFGYVGSYTYTNENGKRYEIMMGHGDRPFNEFEEGQKLPPGTVLGYQGASGTSDDANGGVYDHITFHVNDMDGAGDAQKVLEQFGQALISGESNRATKKLRESQSAGQSASGTALEIYGRLGLLLTGSYSGQIAFNPQDWYNQDQGSYDHDYWSDQFNLTGDQRWLSKKDWWAAATKTVISVWYGTTKVDVEVATSATSFYDAEYFQGLDLGIYNDYSLDLLVVMVSVAAATRWIF